jgi:hypothetical protein
MSHLFFGGTSVEVPVLALALELVCLMSEKWFERCQMRALHYNDSVLSACNGHHVTLRDNTLILSNSK